MPSLLLALAAPAFALDLETPTLVVGEEVTFRATGAPAGESVRFLRGSEGNGPCYAALGGLCLGLTNPKSLGTATADADGVAELTLTLPATVPQVFIGLQAAHGGATPAVSNVTSTPILARSTGDTVINDQASYDAAKMLIEIGYLRVEDGAPADIDLPYLEEVTYVGIEGSTVQTVRADHARLPFARYVDVVRTTQLTSVVLPSLGPAAEVFISENPELSQLELGIDSCIWLYISDAPMLGDLSLDSLGSCTDGIEFHQVGHSAPGGTLSLASLPLAGGLIVDGSGFATVSAPLLTELDGGFGAQTLSVTSNDHLVDLDVANLEMVEDAVYVNDNPALTSLQLSSLTRLNSYFEVARNDALADLALGTSGFPYIVNIVADNPSLPDCVIEAAFYDTSLQCSGNLADACTGVDGPGLGECQP